MAQLAVLTALRSKTSLWANDVLPAYKWTTTDIVTNFLEPLAQNAALWGVAENCRADVQIMCTAMSNWLDPNRPPTGNMFSLFTDMPAVLTAAFRDVTESGKTFKMILPNHRSAFKELPLPGVQNGTIELFGLGVYDVLGWIFSTFSPVGQDLDRQNPPLGGTTDYFVASNANAIKNEFFIPLLLMYAKWCFSISQTWATVKSDVPTMAEIAVRARTSRTLYFTLGASVAGFPERNAAIVTGVRRQKLDEKKLLKLWTDGNGKPLVTGNDVTRVEEELTQNTFLLFMPPSRVFLLLSRPKPALDYKGKKVAYWNQAMTRPEIIKRITNWEPQINEDLAMLARNRPNIPLSRYKEYVEPKELLLKVLRQASQTNPVPKADDIYQAATAPFTQGEDYTVLRKDLTDLAATYRWEEAKEIRIMSWTEMYRFADKWLNPAIFELVSDESVAVLAGITGSPFGNCAETYPLLMLLNQFYRFRNPGAPDPDDVNIDQLNPRGALAMNIGQASKIKDLPDLGLNNTLVGLCMNCQRLMSSAAIHGNGAYFLTGTEKGFAVDWMQVANKVVPGP